jgi:acetyl esterase/lipase
VPVGYLIAGVVAAVPMLLALRPLRTSRTTGRLSWILSCVINEWPLLAVYWVLASTALAVAQGSLSGPGGLIALAVALITPAVAGVLVRRSLRARRVVAEALDGAPGARATPWPRILFAPLPLTHRGVERVSNLSYGDAGKLNTLDVYRRASAVPGPGPILIHLHGGGFTGGRKSFESRPLLLRFARLGWVCISANYRLRPAATFPDFLIDAKRVIAWARSHAVEFGGDPQRVIIAGSSAGAHLAATAALTANDARFQQGFEEADTSVSACVGLYGYYGPVDRGRTSLPSSPRDYVHAGAPPFLIAHGAQDTLVPIAGARSFADELTGVSQSPVVWIDLPGAQHSFDLLRSIRFEALLDGIEAFAKE